MGVLAMMLGCGTAEPPVDSPRDWRDEVLYFAMIDRFANGDAGNDDQGMGEWNPESESHFHGGDLSGVIEELEYIEGLGVTGVWLTPPVLNQWWNPEHTYTGYHGYWASDFQQVDPHFGTINDWKAVANALHAHGLLLIQDVVVNHTGDWVSRDAGQTQLRDRPAASWMQPETGNYHATPRISNYLDSTQRVTHELAGLDDLKTESPDVRTRLRAIYRWWIEEGGADGFRFDTHKYVEQEFWPAFLEGEGDDEGVRRFAERLRNRPFPTFGEVWTHSDPGGVTGELEMLGYLDTECPGGVGAALNFPLQESFLRVFGEGMDAAELAHRLRAQARLFPDPSRQLVNFIDNHDMARFRSNAGAQGTALALRTLFSLPGVPVIYQGTEQGDLSPRANLFARHDTTSEDYRFLQEAIAWRHAHPTVRRGKVVHAAAVEGTPLLHYQIAHEQDTVFVLCNPSPDRIVCSERPSETADRQPAAPWTMGKFEARFAGGAIAFVDAGPQSWQAWSTWDACEREQLQPDAELWSVGGRLTAQGMSGFLSGKHRVQRVSLTREGQIACIHGPHWEHVVHPRVPLADQADGCGDDRGLDGRLVPPTSPGFEHSMDLARVSVWQEGAFLRIQVAMCAPWSTAWSPRFGFDHVAFEVELLDVATSDVQAKWRHSGWSLQPLHGPPPTTDGVDSLAQLEWVLPMPDVETLRLRVDTWDADGNGEWRPLAPEAAAYQMGGPAVSEPVMDRVELTFSRKVVTLDNENSRLHEPAH